MLGWLELEMLHIIIVELTYDAFTKATPLLIRHCNNDCFYVSQKCDPYMEIS